MQKALIAGIDEKILNELYSSVPWGNSGYSTVDIAVSNKQALTAVREKDYDVLILFTEEFPWTEIYESAKNILGKVDLILICQKEDFALAEEAFEHGATGLFSVTNMTGESFPKLLESIYSRRRSSSIIAQFISDEQISEQIYFQLNGNNIPYFESLFRALAMSQEDKEIIRSICVKLTGIIYEYLEQQGFKNAEHQKNSSIKRIGEIPYISDVVNYTKNRYINIFQFETEKKRNYYSALTENIKEYILSNYTGEMLGVPKIAERFHFSANYINGIFKSQTGETIPSYITNLRLNRAKKLLTETKIPVSEIALIVGYSRLTYFSRIFKRKYNISPNEYRNKFSGN